MAITYPRDFPAGIYLRRLRFDYAQLAEHSPLADGQTQSAVLPPHWWHGSWRTLTLFGEDIGIMQAWLNSLKTGAKTFYGRDTQRCGLFRHIDHTALSLGGNPWDGTCTVFDVPALNSVSFTAPAGLDLVPGDRIEIRNNDWHHLAEIEEAASAVAEGILTVTFQPTLPAGAFVAGDTVDLISGRAKMKIADAPPPQNSGRGQVFTFSAVSVL